MAENIGNLFGESANPEMRGTIGPLYAIIASAATMVAGLAFLTSVSVSIQIPPRLLRYPRRYPRLVPAVNGRTWTLADVFSR